VRAVHAQEAARSRAVQNSISAALTTVTKAEKTEQVAAYDQDGRLIGIVDPKNITPVANNTRSPAPAKPATAATQRAQASAAKESTLGGPTPAPRSGAPVQVVDDEDDAVAKVAQLRKTAFHGDSPAERAQAYNALCNAAMASIAAVHRRG
jgi:YD repeat-containing protein